MSQVKANSFTDASGGSNAVLYGVAAPANSMGFRNRILNGGMTIDQRNAGASVSLTSGGGNAFSADRWYVENNTDGTATTQQVSDAPTGLSNSIKYTVTATDSSLASDQAAFIQQRIEGFNSADFVFGTASASSVTISFWVKSSVTGTFGGALANSAYNRGYPFTFTVNSANTWEQKSVTIAGDTTGTWIGSTNGIGLRVTFAVAAGSARVSTAGAWAAYVGIGASGQLNLMATNSATFQITGVQLEAGSVASPFERRDYGRELMMCQRYFYMHCTGNGQSVGVATAYNAGLMSVYISMPVTMRTNPSAYYSTGTGYYTSYLNNSSDAFNSVGNLVAGSTNNVTFDATDGVSVTAGTAGRVQTSSASAYIGLSAEL